MNSNSGSQQNNYYLKNKVNLKDDNDISNINQTDLLIFLQFYFSNAQKNLSKILSDKVITSNSEIYKITSSFNFWLNFSLNFKDTSFVNLLLCKNEDRADFCIKKLKEIIKIIVKFLYDNLNSEEAFNRILKDNYHKLYELILKLKDIVDNVYGSDLKEEIFVDEKEDNNNSIKDEDEKNEKVIPQSLNDHPKKYEENECNLLIPHMADNNINETNQFNQFNQFSQLNNNNMVDIKNVNNIIKNNNNININFINNKESQDNKNNEINIENIIPHNKEKSVDDDKNDNNDEKEINNNNIINNIINENENGNENNMINPNEMNENKIYYNIAYNNNNNNNDNDSNSLFKVKYPSLDYTEINKLFYNFCYFTNFNLSYFQIVFYEKVGYAFLNYNGDFMWADEFSTHVLFEEENIKKLNLFNIMTDFSKYILKKKYKDHFFDFKDENNRLRVFTYTIDGEKNKEQENKKKGEKLFEDLSKIKTLVSRASPVLLNGQGSTYIACIFLETKFSLTRQNFDFFYWKSDWNNK